MQSEYVWVVRAPQMAWDGSKLVPAAPVAAYCDNATRLEAHYATEAEARANWAEHEALPEFCPGDHVYLQVPRAELVVFP